ncbi:MAG: hypothetical protein JXA21_25110 [Anaerolineae bacterium]|nr:hypothetical protein [Anaerolineae bacterium]
MTSGEKVASGTSRQRFAALALIIFAGVGASLLLFWITAPGVGVSSDSTVYIEAAQNFAAGNGFLARGKPMTHYPPTYSFLLAVASSFQHGNIVQAGRLLAVLLFGVNLILFGHAVQLCTKYSLLATSCAILMFLLSAPIITIHAMVWSEALFITFSLAFFILLSRYIVQPSFPLLLSATLMAGFAAATRYIGITLTLPMAFALLVFGDRPMKQKLEEAGLSLMVAIMPLSLWLLRNLLVAQAATDRTFAIHLFNMNHAKTFVNTMYNFVLPLTAPDRIKMLQSGAAVFLFLAGIVLLYRSGTIKRDAVSASIVLPALCIMFSLTYSVFLVVSISFLDADTPLNFRILLPVYLPLAIAGIALAWAISQAFSRRYIWYGFLFIALLSIGINGYLAFSEAMDIHRNGRGYTSWHWQNSEMVSYLAGVRDVKAIYSNAPDILWFLTGKESVIIPWKASPYTYLPNQDYEDQLRQMFEDCREGRALIVYIHDVPGRWFLPSTDALESQGNLPVMQRFEDGAVYGIP